MKSDTNTPSVRSNTSSVKQSVDSHSVSVTLVFEFSIFIKIASIPLTLAQISSQSARLNELFSYGSVNIKLGVTARFTASSESFKHATPLITHSGTYKTETPRSNIS